MPLDEAYFIWLYSQVASTKIKNKSKNYWVLFKHLYNKEFVWGRIERDANRARDGMDLRLQFERDTNRSISEEPGWAMMPCSFLEMLLALAWAVAFEGGGTQAERFWEMIGHLGLLECTDAHPPDEYTTNDILDRVIERRYEPTGAGGLFPLSNPAEDQRDVELWYQANAYLLESL